jgi:hypothetical protein
MQERAAHDSTRFREANEQIGAAARKYGVDQRVPFLCECEDPSCRVIVRMSLASYEEIRATTGRFLNAIGHEVAAPRNARVVGAGEGYVIVETTREE